MVHIKSVVYIQYQSGMVLICVYMQYQSGIMVHVKV